MIKFIYLYTCLHISITHDILYLQVFLFLYSSTHSFASPFPFPFPFPSSTLSPFIYPSLSNLRVYIYSMRRRSLRADDVPSMFARAITFPNAIPFKYCRVWCWQTGGRIVVQGRNRDSIRCNTRVVFLWHHYEYSFFEFKR